MGAIVRMPFKTLTSRTPSIAISVPNAAVVANVAFIRALRRGQPILPCSEMERPVRITEPSLTMGVVLETRTAQAVSMDLK